MKFTELKKGVKVFDRWYPEWGTGWVVKKMKTRVIIGFANMDVYTYDNAHVKYLSKVKVAKRTIRNRSDVDTFVPANPNDYKDYVK